MSEEAKSPQTTSTTSPSEGSSPATVQQLALKTEGLKSSYYHFASTPKELAEQYKPKEIQRTEKEPTPEPPKATGPSSWNKAGTWEERNISDWAHEQITKMYVGLKPNPSKVPAELAVSIKEMDSIDGDVNIVWTRGKKGLHFELEMTMSWEGTYQGEEVEGEIKIRDLDQHSLNDFEIKITASDTKSNAARDILRELFVEDIRAKFREFCDAALKYDE